MTLAISFKAFVVWLRILVLAMAYGAIRESVLVPVLGERSGLIISGVFLSGLIFSVAYSVLPWFGRASVSNYVIIGVGWFCLTVLFEFIFGYIIQGKSWWELLDAYTFKGG